MNGVRDTELLQADSLPSEPPGKPMNGVRDTEL